jgi:hypothetical protein
VPSSQYSVNTKKASLPASTAKNWEFAFLRATHLEAYVPEMNRAKDTCAQKNTAPGVFLIGTHFSLRKTV